MHVLEPGGGGTMRHVLDLAQQQARIGHHVHMIYSRKRLEDLSAPQIAALQNVTLHELPMHRAPGVSDIFNLCKLANILKRIKPDVVHAHSTKAGMLARIAHIFVKTKVIYTPHALMTLDPGTSALKKFVYGAYEKLLSPLMHRMIVLSSFEYDHAAELGIPYGKLVMGINGIAPLPHANRDEIRRGWQVDTDDVIVGFVGRLAHQKNPELAIRAFAKAYQGNPHLKLVMIGDGELRSACEKLANELQVSDRVIFAGAQDAKMLYAGMDMLLITSRYEGMAYTFVEALHAGLPVISTRVGGSDSCVIHGQTGMLTDMNEDDIAKNILLLANDATLRDGMRLASRATARHFTLDAMQELHHGIYLD